MDEQAVRDSLWYHSTTSANWLEDLIKGEIREGDFFRECCDEDEIDLDTTLMVHVGTVDAALDRNKTLTASQSVYVYVLRLKDGVDIAQVIRRDEYDECPVIAGGCAAAGYSTEVTRYVNQFESPGSISLLVNRKCFEVIDRIRLQ